MHTLSICVYLSIFPSSSIAVSAGKMTWNTNEITHIGL